MKVALLANGGSIHAARWANGLARRGLDVHLISAHRDALPIDKSVSFHVLPWQPLSGYFLNAFELHRTLRRIRPELVNVHYASGYGTLARLGRCRPVLLSIWGSDVYDFPQSSPLHRRLLRDNLRYATAVASTSHCMARQATREFPHPHVHITPFGVDESLFRPSPAGGASGTMIVGTVKSLKWKYGVDTLISAFALARQQVVQEVDLRLEITGVGPEREALERQVESLDIGRYVVFHGGVSHDRVPEMLNRLDVYAALSRLDSESFGVAILEAGACEKPVVVSDTEGPAEVVVPGQTGYIVPRERAVAASEAFVKLIRDASLRRRMGEAGRAHVLANYTWDQSLDRMIEAYERTLAVWRDRRNS